MDKTSITTILQRAVDHPHHPTFDGDIDAQAPLFTPTAEAAVLILISDETHKITLTQRQAHMRKHAGQVAFPGGRKDDDDADHWATALREAHEEIGLPIAHPLERIGELSAHNTITRFKVTPCVALNPEPFDYIAQEGEVASIFEIPLTQIHPDNFKIQGHDYNGLKRHFYVLPHPDYFIWGATARMLQNLGQRLKNVGYF